MNIAPIGPAYPTFTYSVQQATTATQAALSNLDQPVNAENIVSPGLGILGNAQAADMWLNDAVDHPGEGVLPTAVDFARQARTDIEDGINLLTHRLNGPVSIPVLRGDLTSALQQLDNAQHVCALPPKPLPCAI
jgi:hypothetical protein